MIVAAVGEQGRGKETSAVFNITENALGQLISSSGNLQVSVGKFDAFIIPFADGFVALEKSEQICFCERLR